MRKQILLCLVSALLVGATTYRLTEESGLGAFKLESAKGNEESGINKARNAKEAMEWRYDRLKDENGNFYYSYLRDAIKHADQMQHAGSRSGLGLQWEELGPDNVGGRTRAILIDRRDPSDNTIYAGGVGGGMWKSLDKGNTWSRLPNWNQWLAVSCITQGPDNSIYVGTGEGLAQITGSSLNSGSMGNGIFKLDANDNPQQITPDNFTNNALVPNDVWSAVNRIAINPTDAQSMVAATGKGLYQSFDGGASWAQVSVTGISGGQSAADVKWASDGINVFAAVGGNNKMIMSPNGGLSWSKVTNVTSPGFPTTQGRIEIAIAPNDPNVVYVSVSAPGGCTYGVYRSGDGGATWASIGNKGPLFDPFGGQCQGWYDNVIAVSPTDANKVYLGGVDFYTWSDQSGWKLADAGLGGGNTNPNYIHPDKHCITISANNPNLMFVGCDGGVYRSTDAITSFPYPNYSVKNRGYNVTQNYSVGAGIGGEVLGGAQDNGTNYIDFTGNTKMAAKEVIGGDGIYAEISHIDPRISFGGVYFGAVRRSGNKTSSYDGFFDIKIDQQGFGQPSRCGGQMDANAPFITPFYLGETRNASNGVNTVPFVADRSYAAGDVVSLQSKAGKYPFQATLPTAVGNGDTVLINDPVRSRLFLTSNCGVWLTSDALDLGIIPKWFKLMDGMSGLANAYAATPNGDILFVGTSGGIVYRFGSMNARCDTTTYPPGSATYGKIYKNNSQYSSKTVASGRSIEGIAVDPYDTNHVVATVAGFSSSNQPHVYESMDGGQTWVPDTAGLPNMPVYDVVIHDANTIVIGSELGIWSWDGSSWHEENNGLPRVPVFRLIEKELFAENCPVMYIGTHGRGMWRSTTLTPSSCQTSTAITDPKNNASISGLNVFPNPVSSSSKISLTLEKSDAVTLRVFDMTGRLYKEVTYKNTIAGENLFELDASGLSNGTYLLAATVANVRTQSRLFVVSK